VAAIQRPQINQAGAFANTGSKRNAALVVVLVALALTAMYLILSRRSHQAPLSNNAASSRDEAAPAANISPYEPKSLTSAEYFEQGMAMTKARKYEEAAIAYQQAIRQDPDMAQAHHELGYAYTQLRQWDKAVVSLKEATALKPDFADSHRLLGDALTRLGQWEEALASYNRAITVKPDSAVTYLGLATVYKHTKQFPDAVNAYLKVIELRPNNAAAHYELGLLYLELDDSDSAQAEYETLMPLNAKLAEKLKQAISKKL
jgi:tetratricopeptide (TPR) repeat protein